MPFLPLTIQCPVLTDRAWHCVHLLCIQVALYLLAHPGVPGAPAVPVSGSGSGMSGLPGVDVGAAKFDTRTATQILQEKAHSILYA